MKLKVQFPLFNSITLVVSMSIIISILVYNYRENALEQLEYYKNTQLNTQKKLIQNAVESSNDFLRFAEYVDKNTQKNSFQNDSLSEEITTYEKALEYLKSFTNQQNISLWIVSAKPPYKVIFASENSDLYADKGNNVSEKMYEKISDMTDLCLRVGDGFFEYKKEIGGKNQLNKTVFVKLFEKKNWVIGAELNTSPIEQLISERTKNINQSINLLLYRIIFVTLVLIVVFSILFLFYSYQIAQNVETVKIHLKKILDGDFKPLTERLNPNTELGTIERLIKKLLLKFGRYSWFAKELGTGNYNVEFGVLEENDAIAEALIKAQKSLQTAQREEQNRRRENQINHWTSEGITKFNDILRQNNENIELLSDAILCNLVKYLGANQGGIFVLNDENPENIYLDLVASYAYDRKKFIKQTLKLGETLVGTVAKEKNTVNIGNLPDEYIHITSGLGSANPNNLLIIPLISESNVQGVLELASFKVFEKYEVAFVERIAESIAATLGAARINEKTQVLLEQSRLQAEEMETKETELRLNIEELRNIHSVARRKENEINTLLTALNQRFSIFKFDSAGFLIQLNDFGLRMFGFKRKQIEAKHHSEILSDSMQSIIEYSEFWDSIVKEGESKTVVKYITSGDKKVWIEAWYTPLFNTEGEVTQVLVLALDLTEKKALERKIQVLNADVLRLNSTLQKK